MLTLIQQSTANDPLFFYLVLASDHISPGLSLSPTVVISKNGGAFGSPSGAVSEIADGWYQVAGNATDTNTLGAILLHATAATADPSDIVAAQVVAFNPRDSNLSLLNVSSNVVQVNGSATAAANVSKANQAICRGTCAGGGSPTTVTTSAFTPGVGSVGQFVGRTMIFDATTATTALQGEATNITASTNAATPTFTVATMTTSPAAGDTFGIY